MKYEHAIDNIHMANSKKLVESSRCKEKKCPAQGVFHRKPLIRIYHGNFLMTPLECRSLKIEKNLHGFILENWRVYNYQKNTTRSQTFNFENAS